MARYVARRLLWLVPTAIVVTFVVYVAIRIGWNPVAAYVRANPRAGEERIEEYRDANGLYDGIAGYLYGYVEWLWAFVQGPSHWPTSIRGGAEVWPQLRYALLNTFRLAGVSIVLGVGLGVGLGILASRRPGGWLDHIISAVAFFAGAIPPFVAGVILQLVFAVQLAWLPPGGVYPPGHQGFDPWEMSLHLALPVTAVAIQTVSQYTRYTRASILDVKSSEYLRVARAKGVGERRLLFRHTLRNSMGPIVTVIGIDLGALLGGLVITENIFNYPGMGVYFLDAAVEGDFPKLMPFMVIVVVGVLLANLAADVLQSRLDPRIELE